MRYLILTLLGLGVVPFVTVASSGPSAPTSAAVPAATHIVNEPIVLYSLSGSTLAGLVHRQLTVYNGGFVTIAQQDSIVIFGSESEDVATASVTPQEASQLLRDLLLAGAATLGDQDITVSDVPLNTLTVLEGDTDARSHTFSYWLPIEQYAQVGQVIDGFIQSTFPGFQ